MGELVIHTMVYLSRTKSEVCCATLHVQFSLQSSVVQKLLAFRITLDNYILVLWKSLEATHLYLKVQEVHANVFPV